jgi:prolyl-tRNA synthetase
MKDMYSLHATAEDCDEYYERVIDAYKRCFERFGIGDSTYVTFASGGAFTKFSHEFQTICDAGEDVLYVNEDKTIAVNEEVLDDATAEIGVDKSELRPVKSAEVGNIFKFGTEKSEKMGIYYTDESGNQKPIYLASYGIGITRVMGVMVEKFADDKGLVWPDNVAPFKVYLASVGNTPDVVLAADELYKSLTSAGVTVLYDDRDERPGTKFADADLIGLPYRVVVSAKTIEAGKYEFKQRTGTDTDLISSEELISTLVTK